MAKIITSKLKKKIAIISSYFANETYGLLGPQMAATIIEENTPFECIVIAVSHEDNKSLLKRELYNFLGSEKPVIGFSLLSGRQDLFDLAGELKEEGATTLLAGPQADVDFIGESEWQKFSHRFKGLSEHFSYALHGPAEQVVPFLQQLDHGNPSQCPGLVFKNKDGKIKTIPKNKWNNQYLKSVDWNNIYTLKNASLTSHKVTSGQVLQQIGCPHASLEQQTNIDAPVSIHKTYQVKIKSKGCGFCDVATDKGFFGALETETVIKQIRHLPENPDERKIPFELINENPLPGLPKLLYKIIQNRINMSQINLTMRADWLLKGQKYIEESLKICRENKIRIVLTSIGFESFDDRILNNFNKGIDVNTNLSAIHLMRQLREKFPEEFGYLRQDGGNHGFIHPTPWDTGETESNISKIIQKYDLASDILPDHSIPLIIHHASALGDWIRKIEEKENIQFTRYGSTIGWWEEEKS